MEYYIKSDRTEERDKSKMWAACGVGQKTYCVYGRWCGKDKETVDHAKICIDMKTDTRLDTQD